jgi:hypothetical protein
VGLVKELGVSEEEFDAGVARLEFQRAAEKAKATEAPAKETAAPKAKKDAGRYRNEGKRITEPSGSDPEREPDADDVGEAEDLEPDEQVDADGALEDGGDGDESGARSSVATKLVELASGLELFHDPDGIGYASIAVDAHKEIYSLRSKPIRSYLARRYFEAFEKAPGGQAVQDALSVLDGKAHFGAPEHAVPMRLASHEGAIYLDLGNAAWEAVEVTASGWRVVTCPPIRFRRSRGMAPLPVPVPGGSIEDLYPFVNVKDEDARKLLVGWLVAALKPTGPYPILCITGEQGTAKSTTSRVVRSLIDPSNSALRTLPREERDLMIAARNSWCVAFDNLSGIAPWISDSLCRLATGGGFTTRELFSDDAEAIFDAQRPILLNGIDDLATRPDLLDRAVVLSLPSIPETERRAERSFWVELEAARPRILGALLDAVSTALKRAEDVRIERLPRMADFATWVTAAEPAFGWPEGACLAAYTRNRGEAVEVGLEADPVAGSVRQLAEAHGSWEGTAGDLRDALEALVPETTRKTKDWPKTAKALTDRFKRIAPALRDVGVEVARGPRAGKGRLWTVTQKTAAEARS